MKSFLRKLVRDKRGATAVEYGLILALICVAILGALSQLASRTIGMWQNVADVVTKA